jgi:osmoprotectant transport system ATP-binding protein
VTAPAIEIEHVSKRYGDVAVLSDVSLAIDEGETFALIGPSGCGKSTTMKLMNRLVEPTSGTVRVRGKDVSAIDVAALRLGIGYVIQDVGLFAHYTIARNVGLVPELLGWPADKREARVNELLEIVGLPAPKFGERYPRQLSGGQRQRAGIARALAADPEVVLLDEPFSALDPITRERMQDEFLALSERLGKTFVFVTHDIFEAVRLADRIGVMRDGKLVQCGTPKEIVHAPADAEVAALLGRHRYQLKLMTTRVDDLARARGRAAGEADGKSLSVTPDANAWDALARLETENAEHVRVELPGAARLLSRDDLLGGAGAT